MADGATRAGLKGQFGWVAYEMGGGPYYNMIRIFVFSVYFQQVLVGDKVHGQEVWGWVESASGLAVALLAAPIGAIAEAYGPRKPAIFLFSTILCAGLFYLWFAIPGTPLLPICVALVVSAAVVEYAYMCHSSLLGLISPPSRIGLLSGLGYSANYFGTLVVMIPWIIFIGTAKVPAFGLSHATHEDVRIVAPLAAIWFILCAILFFVFTPDAPRRGRSLAGSIGPGLVRLGRMIGNASHYANIMRYLISRMIFYDGLVATFTFIGVYASGTFGWTAGQSATFGLLILSILVFAGFIGGIIDDKIGSKLTILGGLFMVATSLIFGLGVGRDYLLFAIPVDAAVNAHGLPGIGPLLAGFGFPRLTEQCFILSSIAGGVFMGPSLASSRTMMARLAPETMMADFFGVYTLTGKATSFIAPAVLALVTRATHDQRAGFAVVVAFILIGFVGLLTVREERAVALT